MEKHLWPSNWFIRKTIRRDNWQTGQVEDCTTGCLLDYDHIKNHYRLIAVDLSRQKDLGGDSKEIQETKLVRPSNKCRWYKSWRSRIYVYFNDFQRNEKNEIKIFLRKCKSIIKMVSYQEARIKLTNIQSNKSKFPGKHKKETILKINKKNFQDKVLLHELFLTTRQATKIRNAFKIICQQIQNLVKLKYLK